MLKDAMKKKAHLILSQEELDRTRAEQKLDGLNLNFMEVADQLNHPTSKIGPITGEGLDARLTHLENTLQRWWYKLNRKKAKKKAKKERKKQKKTHSYSDEDISLLLLELLMSGNGFSFEADSIQLDHPELFEVTITAEDCQLWGFNRLKGKTIKGMITVRFSDLEIK